MARWLLLMVMLSTSLLDVIVCPPVTDKPLPSTPPPPDAVTDEDDVVSNSVTYLLDLRLVTITVKCRPKATDLPCAVTSIFFQLCLKPSYFSHHIYILGVFWSFCFSVAL